MRGCVDSIAGMQTDDLAAGVASGFTRPGRRLSVRTWTMVAGILPIVSFVTLTAGILAGQLPVEQVWKGAIISAVILVGAAIGILWGRRAGVEVVHSRVAATRVRWVESWHGAVLLPDAPADPGDVALALPRSWRAESARGRVRFALSGTPVRAETWVLKAGPGSKRSPRRREVVGVDVPTGPDRFCISVRESIDPLHVTPSWFSRAEPLEPAWRQAVRDRVARHKDVLASLTIGDDRVVLFAMDDPRVETMLRRAELVRDVAAIIQTGRP